MKASLYASRKECSALVLVTLAPLMPFTLIHARTDAPQGGILYFVNTTSDTVVAGACQNGLPNCSLRGAIQVANSHVGADGIEIDLPPGSVINLTGALPNITESVSIMGAGADKLTVRRDTGSNYGIFHITATGTVTFSGMTISNGASSAGAGVLVEGGTVNVLNTTISGNTGFNSGGGIYNSAALNVTNSVISGNSATLGGGIYHDFGTLHLTNSTVAANSATIGGGFFISDGLVSLSNSTICRNVADDNGLCGGVFTQDSHPITKSTIIASNIADIDPDLFGDFSSQGFNVIGIGDSAGGFTQPTDQAGTLAQPLDPKLDPNGLQNNGGPTQTVALLAGSSAIDKGTSNGVNGTLTNDQRGGGFPRALDYSLISNAAGGDGTDIGAFEFGGSLVPSSVSRKMHGAANFDASLPLRGLVGVECRTGGVSNNHQLIMNFPAPVTLTSASVTTGTGSVSNHSVNGSNVTVNLMGVANAQTIVTTLFGVTSGSNTSNVLIPMGVLLGDTNGNGSVNATDVSLTKLKSGQAVDASSFRTDVTVSGSINASDIGLVKSQSGTSLPP